MNSIRTLSVLGLSLILPACATVPNANVEYLKGPLPEGTGMVVAATLNNSVRITGPINVWQEIVLWRADAQEGEKNTTFTISALSGALSTNFYAGAVPSGKYRVGLLWTTKQQGDFTYYAKALVPPKLGTFEVKPGQVTNLGTMIYHPFSARSWADEQMPDYALSRTANPDLWQVIKQSKATIGEKVSDSAAVTSWDPDEFAADRDKATELIESSALPIALRRLDDGTFVLLGKAGGLYLRGANSEKWEKISTETHTTILTTEKLSDGRLYAGGENGFFAAIDPLKGTVEHIRLPRPLSHTLKIIKAGSHDYITTFTGTSFELYRFHPAARRFELSRTFVFNAPKYFYSVSNPLTLADAEMLTVYMDKQCHTLDLSEQAWNTKDCVEFNFLYRQPNGTLIGSPFSAWSGSKSFVYSIDGGDTWIESQESGPLLGGITPSTYRTSSGDFLRVGKDAKFNLFGKGWTTQPEVPFTASTDQGKTWVEIGKLPRRCVNFAADASADEHLFVLCENGDLMNSRDLGETWSIEFSPSRPGPAEFPTGLYFQFEDKDSNN